MKMPFFWLALGITGGILLEKVLKLPPASVFSCFLFLTPFLWLLRGKRLFLPVLLAACMGLGFLYGSWADRRPSQAVENRAASGRLSLEGIVKTSPEIKTQGKKETVSFVLDSRNLVTGKGQDRVWARTRGRVQVFLFNPRFVPELGDRVRLFGELGRPAPVRNPGEFDYRQYLARQGIHAVFRGFGRFAVRRIGDNEAGWFWGSVERIRKNIEARIERLFDPEKAVLFKAFILGMRKDVPSDVRDLLMKTGTAHLMAISGLHIALVSGFFYCLLIFAGIPQKPAAGAALVLLVLHVAVSGMAVSVRRAGIMAGAGFLGLLLEREKQALNTFFLAFLFIVLSDPRSLGQLSFQLSFLSVLSLILLFKSDRESWRGAEIFSKSAAVMAGTFPVVVYYFNIFSPVSLLANLLAIPLFHLSLLSAFFALGLGGLPGIGQPFVWLASGSLEAVLFWIRHLAAWRWGYFYLATPSWLQLAAYYVLLAGFIGLKIWERPGLKGLRAGILGLWLIAAFSFLRPVREAAVELTLFAAGKNEMAHLAAGPREHWLINTGRGASSGQARWILYPFLRRKGVRRLKAIVLTDDYRKHTGGLEGLLDHFETESVFYPVSMRRKNWEGSRQFRERALRKGDRLNTGSGRIEILDTAGGELLFVFSSGPWDVLFVPSWKEEVIEALERGPIREEIEVLALPSLPPSKSRQVPQLMERILDRLDPVFVVLPHEEKKMRQELEGRDIFFAPLSRYGALQISFLLAARQEMQVQSVLKGRIGNWQIA